MRVEFLQQALWVLTLSAIAFAASEDTISLDEIVQRHITALGGRDKIAAVHATITLAEYREGDFVIPHAFMAKMLPYYRTICDPREKLGDVCEGYDGSAWEWYADPGVLLRVVGPAAAATRHGTEFIDSLVEPKSRGTTVELAGADTSSRLAAVFRAKDAAVGIRRRMMPECGDVDDVRVRRMNADLGNILRVDQPDLRPRLARVRGLVGSVALNDVAADVRFAGADVNDIRIGWRNRDGADR